MYNIFNGDKAKRQLKYYYYQTNGKTPQENLIEIHRSIREDLNSLIAQRKIEQQIKERQKKLDAEIEQQATETAEEAIDKLLEAFDKNLK